MMKKIGIGVLVAVVLVGLYFVRVKMHADQYRKDHVIEFTEHKIRVECPAGTRVNSHTSSSEQSPHKVLVKSCSDGPGSGQPDRFILDPDTEKLLRVLSSDADGSNIVMQYYAKPNLSHPPLFQQPPGLLELCGGREVDVTKKGFREIYHYPCEPTQQAAMTCPVKYVIEHDRGPYYDVRCVDKNGEGDGNWRKFIPQRGRKDGWTEVTNRDNETAH